MEIGHDIMLKESEESIQLNINLYGKSEKLFNILSDKGILERLQQINQLGLIGRIDNEKCQRTRYDYMMLQLYLHGLIKNDAKNLKYAYNSKIQDDDFINKIGKDKTGITIGEVIQILIITYNIGHFYNTFTASKGLVFALEQEDNNAVAKWIKRECTKDRTRKIINTLIKRNDYRNIHLINSVLILDRCNNEEPVFMAREIIFNYLYQDKLSKDSKLRYAFNVFKIVRNIAYIINDLPMSELPFNIDLQDKNKMNLLFYELLANNNNHNDINNIIKGLQKLLDEYMYNQCNKALFTAQISKKIGMKIKGKILEEKTYYNLFFEKESFFNKLYEGYDASDRNILKLTFPADLKTDIMILIKEIDNKLNVDIGYYFRENNDITILVGIKIKAKNRRKIALKIFKMIFPLLEDIHFKDKNPQNMHYTLLAKFLLIELFDVVDVQIEGHTGDENYLMPALNKWNRDKAFNQCIKKIKKEAPAQLYDQINEVEWVQELSNKILKKDEALIIYGSTKIKQKNHSNKYEDKSEFDGIIIFPNKKKKQVVFLEAKNRNQKETLGKECLKQKLKLNKIEFDEKRFIQSNKNWAIEIDI